MQEVISVACSRFSLALSQANEELQEGGRPYFIGLRQESVDPTQPVRLKAISIEGQETPIGVIHLIRLEGEDFDDRVKDPNYLKEIALTIEEVKRAILQRAHLYFTFLEAKKEHTYVHLVNGELFDFGDIDVVIDPQDHTFSLGGKKVKWKGEPLSLSRLLTEHVFSLRRLDNGHIAFYSDGDKRVGKGIFVDEEGEIYRA